MKTLSYFLSCCFIPVLVFTVIIFSTHTPSNDDQISAIFYWLVEEAKKKNNENRREIMSYKYRAAMQY